jgi:hypothetical protein
MQCDPLHACEQCGFLHRCRDGFCFPKVPQWRKVLVTASKAMRRSRSVLNNLSEQIHDCLQHAEDCARRAASNRSGLRGDFLRLQKRWLELARSLEFAERLSGFTNNIPNGSGQI